MAVVRVLPESRRVRIAVLVGAVIAAGAVALAWDDLMAALERAIPSRAFASAEGRTSTEAPESAGAALPSTMPAPRPPGRSPRIDLELIREVASPSALFDPRGAGPVLVAAQVGVLHALDVESGDLTTVLDLTDRVRSGGEQGLLGVAVDPATDRLHLAFTNERGDVEIRSWPFESARADRALEPDDGVLHLTIGKPYANHNGGNLVFGPDGTLWIGTGDGGSHSDPERTAQRPDRILGKMLRVVPNPDGGVTAPSTNPDWGGRREIWGIGFRNPWRYSFDRATNRLWIADVGESEIEEVSVVDPDIELANFGWSHVEGSREFNGESDPDFIAPVVEYTHADGCSITGGYVYRGDLIPSLYGWYLFADFCGGWVRAVPSDDPTREPVELVTDAGNIVSFGELEDGELMVLTSAGVYSVVASSG
jgi:glucose/arabinose dehydrogenase